MFTFQHLGSLTFRERINILQMFENFLHENLPSAIFRDIIGEILFSSVLNQELFYKMGQMASKEYGNLGDLGKLGYMDPYKIIYCINDIKCNNIIDIINDMECYAYTPIEITVIRSENISNNNWRPTNEWSLQLFKKYFESLDNELADLVTIWNGHESYIYPIKYIPQDWRMNGTDSFICKVDSEGM